MTKNYTDVGADILFSFPLSYTLLQTNNKSFKFPCKVIIFLVNILSLNIFFITGAEIKVGNL